MLPTFTHIIDSLGVLCWVVIFTRWLWHIAHEQTTLRARIDSATGAGTLSIGGGWLSAARVRGLGHKPPEIPGTRPVPTPPPPPPNETMRLG